MPCVLLLLWVGSAVLLCACAIGVLRELKAPAEVGERIGLFATVFGATVPPTMVLLVSAFVLLQAAPTAQFNAGRSRAMELWSFWVHWHQIILACSMMMTGIYAICFFGSLITKTRRSVRFMVGFAFLTSLWGSLLVGMAYPTA